MVHFLRSANSKINLIALKMSQLKNEGNRDLKFVVRIPSRVQFKIIMGKQAPTYKKKKCRLTLKAIHKKKVQSNTMAFIKEMSNTLTKLHDSLKYDNSESSCCTEIITKTLKKKLTDKNIVMNVNYDQKTLLQWAYKQSQICQSCHKWEDNEKLIYCDPCEDVYHMKCVNLSRKPGPDWVCPMCKTQRRFLEIEQVKEKKIQLTIKSQNTKCGFCKISLRQIRSQCLQCKNMFHKKCFSQDKNPKDILIYLCCFCRKSTIDRVRVTNTLYRYFPPIVAIKQVRNSFFLPQPYKNSIQKSECQESLFYALESQKIKFSDKLIYDSVRVEQNNTTFEHLIQKFEDRNLFKEFKMRTHQACYGPLIVEHDNIQGFVVRAQDDIAKGTLICEYVGLVHTYRELVFSVNDSIMTLLKTARSETTLVILPEKSANIAKFISGINNHVQELVKKQNVASMRVDVDNQARVLMYTSKQIKKGDLLYYDYNAGGDNNYNTQNFV